MKKNQETQSGFCRAAIKVLSKSTDLNVYRGQLETGFISVTILRPINNFRQCMGGGSPSLG